MNQREKLLGMKDLPAVELEIPEWDGEVVNVRPLTAGEVEDFGNQITNTKGKGLLNVMAGLVVKVLVDELGDRIFGDDDVEAVAAKNAGAVKRIFDKAQAVSGLGEDLTGN